MASTWSFSNANTSEAPLKPSTSAPSENFKQLAVNQLTSRNYTDFIIRAGYKTWPVHSVVICPQSEHFKKAMSGPWQENKTREISLDDPPELVDAFIQILYGGTGGEMMNKFRDLTRLHTLSTKYFCPVVQQKTAEALSSKIQLLRNPNELIPILRNTYGEVGAASQGLKDIYLTATIPHLEQLFQNEGFCELLTYNPAIGVGLMKQLSKQDGAQASKEGTQPVKRIYSSIIKRRIARLVQSKEESEHLFRNPEMVSFLLKESFAHREERELFCYSCAAVIAVADRITRCPACQGSKFREITDYVKA